MFDEGAPPTKRLRICVPPSIPPRSNATFARKKNNRPKQMPRKNLAVIPRFSPNPWQDVRKRKIATRRPAGSSINSLHPHVLMEVIDYLSLEDLCNLADTSGPMRQMARDAFVWRARDGLNFYREGAIDFRLVKRVFSKFGHLVSSITISTRR